MFLPFLEIDFLCANLTKYVNQVCGKSHAFVSRSQFVIVIILFYFVLENYDAVSYQDDLSRSKLNNSNVCCLY